MKEQHERKCWDCGNVAIHESRIVPGVLCSKCGSQDTRATKKPKPFEPPIGKLHSACLTIRHDYGIMPEESRADLRATAMEWFRAFQREGLTQ